MPEVQAHARATVPPVAADVSGLRQLTVSAGGAVGLTMPLLLLGVWMIRGEWLEREAVRLALVEASQSYERLVVAPPASVLDATTASHGREVYMTTCIACHGTDARGIGGLGKNLVESDFVAQQSDSALQQFITKGRTGPLGLMPPKGNREDLTDNDIRDVAQYLRGVQDPRRMPALAAYVPPKPAEATAEEKNAALVLAGGDAELAGYIASGKKIFNGTCIACHGKGGVGIQGNGKALANNPFVQSLDDEALLKFVQGGRAPSDPKNTTGIQMPPKGGNPALSEDDILDVISYVRTLQPKQTAASAGK